MHNGPRRHGKINEKAKDFKGSIKRLLKELKGFNVLIVLSLFLASLGSILSILSPNQLSKLTNTISDGLVINEKNFEKLTTEIPTNFASGNIADLNINGSIITIKDQQEFMNILSTVNKESSNDLYNKIDTMPESIQNVLKPHMDMNKIKNIALLLAILYVTSAIFTYIESIAMTDVSNKFARKLRKRISDKINKLPLKYF